MKHTQVKPGTKFGASAPSTSRNNYGLNHN